MTVVKYRPLSLIFESAVTAAARTSALMSVRRSKTLLQYSAPSSPSSASARAAADFTAGHVSFRRSESLLRPMLSSSPILDSAVAAFARMMYFSSLSWPTTLSVLSRALLPRAVKHSRAQSLTSQSSLLSSLATSAAVDSHPYPCSWDAMRASAAAAAHLAFLQEGGSRALQPPCVRAFSASSSNSSIKQSWRSPLCEAASRPM
mmetsp:Transcript_32885/g.78748  ORF Transcript_32885/g.78748 Transcript_32885/m.78748 type:complete len:204 (-) Transcript_32885:886-1497(-)